MPRPWTRCYEPHVPAALELPSTLLSDRLVENSRSFPKRAATIFFGTRLTYRALNEAVDRFAAGLQQLGVVKGDRVALHMPNCPQYAIAYYGALRAGAIAVPCNPLYVARELQHQLIDSGAKVAVVLSSFYNTLQSVRASTPLEHVIVANIKDYFPLHLKAAFTLLRERKEGHQVDLRGAPRTLRFTELLARAPRQPQPVRIALEDSACLLYTGGTTGTPKGAELTQRNLLVNALQCHVWFKTNIGNEVITCALPFSHGYGMTTCLNYGVFAASTLLLIPNPRELKYVLETTHKYRATFLPGVPTLFLALSNYEDVARYDLSSVRACISGGATLSRQIKERFEALTGGKVVEGYGLSEASPVTHANPVHGGGVVGAIGLPWPEVDCKIVSTEDGTTELGPGERGELWIRGPQVMKGYWKQPDETDTVLCDGWLRTGDIASMDEQGYFVLHARKKDLIIAGGYKIYPGEIEETLFQHPHVYEAAAVGVPHPYRGETVKVFIVPKEGAALSEQEIIGWCKERLAKYKVPTAVEFRPELPKSAVGKVLRRKLVEPASAARALGAPPAC